MLREILAITGKPGLFRIVSQGNRMLLVEELKTKKRFPAHSRDKVVSLGDIAMYTDSGDKPLGEILDLVYAHNGGKTLDVKKLIADGTIRDEFEAVIPDFDKERVYNNDILVEEGFTKFTEDEPEANGEDAALESESK